MARAELSTQSRKVSSLSSTYEYKSKKTPSLKEKKNFCDQNLHKFFKQFFFTQFTQFTDFYTIYMICLPKNFGFYMNSHLQYTSTTFSTFAIYRILLNWIGKRPTFFPFLVGTICIFALS